MLGHQTFNQIICDLRLSMITFSVHVVKACVLLFLFKEILLNTYKFLNPEQNRLLSFLRCPNHLH